jgi:hypothetical protein
LDYIGNMDNNLTQETSIPALSVPKKNNRFPLRCSETKLVDIYDLSDEDAGWRILLSEASKARYLSFPIYSACEFAVVTNHCVPSGSISKPSPEE